jgi:hypothetical protein
MAFDPKTIKTGIEKKARKLIVYGPPKLGKSTFVGSAKNALMIPTENRVDHIQCAKTDVITSYQELLDIFDYLLNNEKHTYKRIILDTLDEFEPLLHKAICEKHGWDSLVEDKNKEVNFSKGLKYHAVVGWRKFLNNCDAMRDAGFDIIFVAHSQIIKINPPDKETYDKYAMKVDPNALPIIEGWADIIGFYDQELFINKQGDGFNKRGKAISTDKRILHLQGNSAAMSACNSYGFGDAEIVDLQHCPEIMEWLLTETKK